MCEFKKTKENPPIALKNAVLKNSAYTTWDEAKKEWESNSGVAEMHLL